MSGLRILLMLALLGLTACGGSNSSTPNPETTEPPSGTDSSDLYISLTDAEGDFLSYEVAVTHISLVRANGTVVEALPYAARVDFAQYVELSELVTLVSAPAGRYDSASLTLDFTDAVITVQGEDGAALPATAVDTEGALLTQVEMEVQFGDRDGFVLLPGRPAHLSLDFDLDASNTIDISGDNARVTVNPILIADVLLEEPKPLRLRGLLTDVYVDRAAFEMDLRPFRIRDRAFASVEVQVDDNTAFEINGEFIANEEGLIALAELGVASPLVVFGEWDRQDRSFVATEVRAGTSVPWGEADALRGTVVARTGNQLLVRGATVELAEGQFTFNDELNVLVSEQTRVVQHRDPEADIQDISVGSSIFVSGEFVDDATLDASAGVLRIVPTSISGTVVSASPLAIDLAFINGRHAAVFDFSGTGISPENDADPAWYEIATATLSLNNMTLGDPVRAIGWVSDFATAPEDFEALSLRNAANVKGHFLINYGEGGATTAVASLGEDGILFDLSAAGTRHHMVFAGIPVDLSGLQAGVPLLAPANERGIFAITIGNRIVVATWYSRFLELLEEELANGHKLVRVDAHGYYEASSNIFSSQRLRIRLTADNE